MNGELVIANAAAARLLEPEDHAGVWEQVGRRPRGRRRERGRRPGQRRHGARRHRPDHRRRPVGGRPGAPRRSVPDAGTATAAAGAARAGRARRPRGGRSWTRPSRSPGHASTSSSPGEDGTGKLAVARAIHALGDAAAGPFEVIDVANADASGTAWLDGLRTAVARPGTVVLRHLDQLPAAQAAAVAAACEARAGPPHRDGRRRVAGDGAAALIDRFPAHLVVPTLRRAPRRRAGRRPPSCVAPPRRRRGRHPVATPSTSSPAGRGRATSASSRACSATPSPGAAAVIITVDDLPVELPVTRRAGVTLTTMQASSATPSCAPSTPRTATAAAAAARLGISRSTLYRKLGDVPPRLTALSQDWHSAPRPPRADTGG